MRQPIHHYHRQRYMYPACMVHASRAEPIHLKHRRQHSPRGLLLRPLLHRSVSGKFARGCTTQIQVFTNKCTGAGYKIQKTTDFLHTSFDRISPTEDLSGHNCIWPCDASIGPVSMALQATESCVLIGSPRAKFMVVKWFNSHFCPPHWIRRPFHRNRES